MRRLRTWRGGMIWLHSICRTGSEQPRTAASRYRPMEPFVPVVSIESTQPSETARECRFASIEIVIGAITVRVPSGAEARDIEAVSPVVLGLFGRIVPSDATTDHDLSIRRNPKLKLQASGPSNPETLQTQSCAP